MKPLTDKQIEDWRGITDGFMDPKAKEEFNAVIDLALSAKRMRDSLEWSMQYGDWGEACDGNPLMKMEYDKAQDALSRAKGVK